MSLYVFLGILAVIWLASIVTAILAFRWSYLSVPGRSLPAIILSLAALAISYYGLTRFHFDSTRTVNGQVKWRFDSNWLFTVSLILGACALTYTLWKKAQSARTA
jgi:hypothetical protein